VGAHDGRRSSTAGYASSSGNGNGADGRAKLDIRNIVEGPMVNRDGYDG
jgi:hypothetical protein